MDITALMDTTLAKVNHWFIGDEPIHINASTELWLIAVVVFLAGLFIGYRLKAKAVDSIVEPSVKPLEKLERSSDVYLQLLLVESKLIFERYQGEAVTVFDNSLDGTVNLSCSVSAADLMIFNSGIEDLKALNHRALREQIIKANTLFRLALASLQQSQKLQLECEKRRRFAASSQKPIDDNASAKARFTLQQQLQRFEQEHSKLTAQMQQMFTMIRSYKQKN